jgi:hypothetical protein
MLQVTDELFGWRNDLIVLLAEREGANFVLARGWMESDRLTDVRRWTFHDPRLLAAQVLRLVREATGREPEAYLARDSALLWALTPVIDSSSMVDLPPASDPRSEGGYAAD